MIHNHLRIISPLQFHDYFQNGLKHTDREFTLEALPPANGSRNDPYRIKNIIDDRPILLVVPRNRGPAKLIPSPLVGETPVGIVQANNSDDLTPWLYTFKKVKKKSKAECAVLAMGKNIYLNLGMEVIQNLKQEKSFGNIRNYFADSHDRAAVCRRLANGPDCVLYVGHGRNSGWSGYQTIKWKHIETYIQQPSGVVFAFSCRTVSRQRNAVPFGSKWILAGNARTYVGSIADLPIAATVRLTRIFSTHIPYAKSVGDLFKRVKEETGYRSAEGKALRTFRILGDPGSELMGD